MGMAKRPPLHGRFAPRIDNTETVPPKLVQNECGDGCSSRHCAYIGLADDIDSPRFLATCSSGLKLMHWTENW